jgi:hypothetical protein
LRGDGPHNLKHSLTNVVGAYGALHADPGGLDDRPPFFFSILSAVTGAELAAASATR